jgi:Sep15/SelM redox domain
LNRYPLLKSFLKDGEAEWYRNVRVTYIAGHHEAILNIYDQKTGMELEKVVMHTLPDKAAMHAMMVSKGFVLDEDKKAEALRREKERLEAEAAEAAKDEGVVRQGSFFSDINHLQHLQHQQQASSSQAASSSTVNAAEQEL